MHRGFWVESSDRSKAANRGVYCMPNVGTALSDPPHACRCRRPDSRFSCERYIHDWANIGAGGSPSQFLSDLIRCSCCDWDGCDGLTTEEAFS